MTTSADNRSGTAEILADILVVWVPPDGYGEGTQEMREANAVSAAKAVLAALSDAGLSIVDRERLEQVERVAEASRRLLNEVDSDYHPGDPVDRLIAELNTLDALRREDNPS